MYKAYLVPDATECETHAEIYTKMLLFYDPRSESNQFAIMEPKTKEELNKSGSFEFTVLPSNIHYNDFHKKISMVVLFDDDEWLYEGVVTDAPIDFYKKRKVSCSGPLSFFCDSIQAPDESNTVELPTSPSGTVYSQVPDVWLSGANPSALNWYEIKSTTGKKVQYKLTNDTSVKANKRYFYAQESSGKNYSGTTITKSAATEETIKNHLTRLLGVHNSQVNAFKQIFLGDLYKANDTETHEFDSSGFRTTWDALKSDILDEHGRYFTVSRGDDNELRLNYLDLKQVSHSTGSSDNTSIIELGTNLVELSESDDSDDDIFTVLVPIGNDDLTVADVTGHDDPEHPEKEISPYIANFGGNKRYVAVSPKAIDRYGYIVKTETFSSAEDASTLYDKAVEYIENNYDYHTEYQIKAIDLFFIDEATRQNHQRIYVGDRVRIRSKWHGINTTDLYAISVEHDLANPENDSYRFGVPTSDKEANNRNLTDSASSTASSAAATAASAAASSGRLSSILEDYIHVTEWGLEMSTNLKNEVSSNDEKYTTRFTQTDTDLNLYAQKLFGISGNDGSGDEDAGYIKIFFDEYKESNGKRWKNPVANNWYKHYKDGKYRVVPSTETTITEMTNNSTIENINGEYADGYPQYYRMRLATRVSSINCGEGGLKAKVDGNYEKSIYCSSWIMSNEDSITALTGHLYVDEDGHVKINSGSGMRTDHEEENTVPTYIEVARSMYSQNPNPYNKSWYERVFDDSGTWLGENKSDSATNDNYYTRTTDREVNRSKYYYYKSNVRETFVAEYGVYDSNNLTAGVVATMINNPTYKLVNESVVKNLALAAGSPASQGWWEVDQSTGQMGLTMDTTVARDSQGRVRVDKYYERTNNYTTYSAINGAHVVIGKTDSYQRLTPEKKAKVDAYIADNNLDGTITEIASDVVVVNALIADYIESEVIKVGSYLSSDIMLCNHIRVDGVLSTSDEEGTSGWPHTTGWSAGIVANSADIDWLRGGHTQVTSLRFSPIGSDVGFGYGGGTDAGSGLARLADPSDIIVGFGTITTSGDTVNIPYTTLYDYCQNTVDNTHKLSFNKPASLGTVTWSNGSVSVDPVAKGLTVKTAGGVTFFEATLNLHEIYSGSSVSYGLGSDFGFSRMPAYMASKPVIKASMSIDGTWTGESHDSSEDDPVIFTKNLYIDATAPYNDGYGAAINTVRTGSGNYVDGDHVPLAPGGSSVVKAQYKALGQNSWTSGNLAGIEVHAPSIRIHSTYSSTEYGQGETIALGYGKSVNVWAQYSKYNDNGTWYNANQQKIVVTAKAKPTVGTHAQYGSTVHTSATTIIPEYGQQVKVKGSMLDADGNTTYGPVITIQAPDDNATSISGDDIDTGYWGHSIDDDGFDFVFSSSIASYFRNYDGSEYVTFEVHVGNVVKRYAIDMR